MAELAHQIVNNVTSQVSTADGTRQTLTNGALLASGLTLAARYLLVAKAASGNDGTSSNVNFVDLFEATGSPLAYSTQQYESPSSGATGAHDYGYVGEKIATANDIQMRVQAVSGTLTTAMLHLMAINLSDLGEANYTSDEDVVGIVDVTAAFEDTAASISIGDGTSDYMVFCAAQFLGDNTVDDISLGVQVAAETVRELNTRECEDTADQHCLMGFTVIEAPIAATTVKVQVASSQAAADLVRAYLIAIKLNVFEDYIAEYAAADVAIHATEDTVVMTGTKTTETADTRKWGFVGHNNYIGAGAGQTCFSWIETNEDAAGLVTKAGSETISYEANNTSERHGLTVFGEDAAIANDVVLIVNQTVNNFSGSTPLAGENSIAAFTWEFTSVDGFIDVDASGQNPPNPSDPEVAAFITQAGAETGLGINNDFRLALFTVVAPGGKVNDYSIDDLWLRYKESL